MSTNGLTVLAPSVRDEMGGGVYGIDESPGMPHDSLMGKVADVMIVSNTSVEDS